MRLKKGDQVEVLSKKQVSGGSWSCAEIISGNGHTYSVRYRSFPMTPEEAVERVPRSAIRPCPPPVEGPNVWAAGDLAEVFHNFSWKQAKIIKIVGVDSYIARLLGSPLDVMVCQSHLRTRQAWHGGKWFVLGKAPELSGLLSRKRQTSVGNEPNILKSKDRQLVVVLPTRPQKRQLPRNSEDQRVSIKKRKVAEKDVRYLPLLARTTDDMYLPQELHRIRSNSPFPTENIEVSTGDVGLREGNLIPGTSTHSYTDSCASSVGSNSSTDDFFKVPFISVAHHSNKVEDEDYYSDAESSTGWGHGEGDSSSNEEVVSKSHSPWHFI
ncbi:uncharacterized protein LOC111020085 isoform X3 [Momordica charantia]|uniref:Uncharacterized protein LOC111020085 isoform X3 n=1 Tax=Momordica charantia TaxID=3673 RepID=A0A6J1DDQ6_MOMCH|nr:uncharacterized protein LOC111020085 isoform X3 [Momordica charantia]